MKPRGKLSPRVDPDRLALGRRIFSSPRASSGPPIDWLGGLEQFDVLGNNNVGDCTVAAAGHAIQTTAACNRQIETPATGDVLAAYRAISGWDGVVGSTSDTGACLADVLEYWQASGICGVKALGYVSLPLDQDSICAALLSAGFVYAGLQLPESADDATSWTDIKGAPAGGHCVPIVRADSAGCTVITWGETMVMSWPFWAKYGDEAHAVFLPTWDPMTTAPNGFTADTIRAELEALHVQ